MAGVGNYDASVNNQISRYDFAQIIATGRLQALIRPVVLVYNDSLATGYAAGTVLAQYTSGPSAGFFGAYNDSGASGLATAVCVLLTNTQPASAGTLAAPAVFRGNLYYSKLIGLDANGKTDLGGRVVGDAVGQNQIFIF